MFQKNTSSLLHKMLTEQTTQIYTLASDHKEYERFIDLLNGSSRGGITPEYTRAVSLARGITGISTQLEKSNNLTINEIAIVHDPCDIRKPYSKKMGGLGKVKSLDKKIINGYCSFNSIAVHGQQLHLLECTPFSNSDSHLNAIGAPCYTIDAYQQEQIARVDAALKAKFSGVTPNHILDRQFDDIDYFTFIHTQLHSYFTIRLKLNRNAAEQYLDEQAQKLKFLKLRTATFTASFTRHYEKWEHKGKIYQNVKAIIDYMPYELQGHTFYVLRLTLLDRKGNPIFNEPMLMITNKKLTTHEIAYQVVQTYFLRSKIEGVFKFLKEQLGWEDFRTQDFLAIQNIIVLCFFVGAFFYENQDEITRNYHFQHICILGGAKKGQFTRFFFRKGLVVMANVQKAQLIFQQLNLNQNQIQELLNFVKPKFS